MMEKTSKKEVKKEVKTSKKGHPQNFYLYVSDKLKKGCTLKDIAQDLNMSKQNLQYHISPLKKREIIQKVGYGTWEVNNKKMASLLKSKTSKKGHRVGTPSPSKDVRAHGFVFTVKLPSIPDWGSRVEFLKQNGIPFKSIPQGQRIKIRVGSDVYKVWLCDESLVIYFPKSDEGFLKESAEQGYYEALHLVKRVVRAFESLFGVEIRFKSKYKIKCSRNHYANVKNALAKYYDDNDRRLMEVRDSSGDLWLLMDNSFNLEELETVNNDTAVEDMDEVVKPVFEDIEDELDLTVQEFFNDRRENREELVLPSELQKMFKGFLEKQSEFVEEQGEFNRDVSEWLNSRKGYAEAIENHNEVINDIKEGVQGWNERLDTFFDAQQEILRHLKAKKRKGFLDRIKEWLF